MCRNTKQDYTPGVPCALQHYWPQDRLVRGGHHISQGQRQMVFQNWVAYDRPQSSDVSAEEYLMCPLLWCRCEFNDLESTLQHVSKCPCLSNGWYWCPYCRRPERFMDAEGSFAEFPRCLPQRKGSKLKRAVTFFKHLGMKTCPKSCRSSRATKSTIDCYADLQGEAYVNGEMLELADTPPQAAKSVELSSDTEYGWDHWEHSTVEEGKAFEMENPLFYSEMMSTDVDSHIPAELDNTSKYVSTLFHGAEADINHVAEKEMLVSPMSNTPSLFSHRSTLDLASQALPEAVNPTMDPFESMLSFESVHNDHSQAILLDSPIAAARVPLLNSSSINSCSDRTPASTRTQIEELRDFVHILNFEWTRRLDAAPNLNVSYAHYYIPSLFETGIQILQRCYERILPTTFKEVFALMHIACAAVYFMHGNDSCYRWDDLFQDVLRWQDVIWEPREVQLLIDVTDLLWSSDRVTASHISMAASAQASGPHHRSLNIAAQRQSAQLIDSLRSGTMMVECSKFLNAFEYAGLVEDRSFNHRNLAWYAQNHVTNIQEMLFRITARLQNWKHIGALDEIIVDAEHHLRNGSLRCAREVEVWLSASGRPTSVPQQVYESFLENVAAVCNDYMQGVSTIWREQFYIADLNRVLALPLEIAKTQQQAAQTNLPRQIIPTNSAQIPCISPLDRSLEAPWAINEASSSPSTSTPGSSTQSTGWSSSTLAPDSSFSLFSLPSTLSNDDVTSCEYCGRVFTGLLQDRKSNLARHIRNKHDNVEAFECTVVGCGSILRRKDNLQKHIRTVHQKTRVLGGGGVIKRRRVSAKV